MCGVVAGWGEGRPFMMEEEGGEEAPVKDESGVANAVPEGLGDEDTPDLLIGERVDLLILMGSNPLP